MIVLSGVVFKYIITYLKFLTDGPQSTGRGTGDWALEVHYVPRVGGQYRPHWA